MKNSVLIALFLILVCISSVSFAQYDLTANLDSTNVKDGGLSGSDFVNPLRLPQLYLGNGSQNGTLYFVATDGDTYTTAINTDDQAVFSGASRYLFDQEIQITSGSMLLTAGASPTYALTATNGALTLDPAASNTQGFSAYNSGSGSFSVGLGTSSPVTSTVTVGGKATEGFLITLEQTPAGADSSWKLAFPGGVPTATWLGTDGDTYTQSINTNDQALFSGASRYIFDNDVQVTDGAQILYSSEHLVTGFQDSSRSIDLTQDTWARITNVSANLFAQADSVRITESGDTWVSQSIIHKECLATLSFNGNNGETFEFKFVNTGTGTVHSFVQRLDTSANNEAVTVTIMGYWEPAVDDVLELQCRNITDNDDIVLFSGQMFIKEILHQ